MSGVVPASQETASPPSATAGGVSTPSGTKSPLRAALYVDGFNLYHSIDDLRQPHLKWLNLWALGERMIPRNAETLVKVRYFTARKPGDLEKNKRHEEYMTALKFFRVEITRGHFIDDQMECKGCNRTWDAPKEKETDVNLALAVIDDAYQNLYDIAYVLTADSDHAPTARLLKERFPEKKFVSVVPPGMEVSKAILTHTSHKLKIPTMYIEDSLLPAIQISKVQGKDQLIFRCPPQYALPAGWVPPHKRKA